jgi:acyl carrier protein
MIRERDPTVCDRPFLFGQPQLTSGNALSKRIFDSTGVLEMVAFLEQTFAFQVENSELTPENLDSIRAITAFVSRKRAKV